MKNCVIQYIRYIASGLIILGVGSFLFAIPHFLSSNLPSMSSGELEVMSEHNNGNLCNEKQSFGNASEEELPTSLAYHRCWFILGQILHGVGAAPILTLGKYNSTLFFFHYISENKCVDILLYVL